MRREKPPITLTITDEQVAAAMDRALALRRASSRDPHTVRATALTAADAMRATLNRRRISGGSRMMRGRSAERDAWVWIGWVSIETEPWGFATALGQDRDLRTWEVWLDPTDERVWLKLERVGRFADDPYP